MRKWYDATLKLPKAMKWVLVYCAELNWSNETGGSYHIAAYNDIAGEWIRVEMHNFPLTVTAWREIPRHGLDTKTKGK